MEEGEARLSGPKGKGDVGGGKRGSKEGEEVEVGDGAQEGEREVGKRGYPGEGEEWVRGGD